MIPATSFRRFVMCFILTFVNCGTLTQNSESSLFALPNVHLRKSVKMLALEAKHVLHYP